MPIQIDAARKGSIAQFIKEKVEVGATVCSGGRKGVPARSVCLGFRLFILSKDKKRHRKVSFAIAQIKAKPCMQSDEVGM